MNVTSAATNQVAVRALVQQVATRIASAAVSPDGPAATPPVAADPDDTLGTLLDVDA